MHVVANDNSKSAPPAAAGGVGRGRLPTGSLHTEAREPAQADSIKKRLTALVNLQQRLATFKRSSHKHFFEVGEILHRVRDERLFEVKGYGSFEAFIEREVNLGQQFCATTVRIYETFRPEAAHALGFARLSAAICALDDEASTVTAIEAVGKGSRPAIPPHKL